MNEKRAILVCYVVDQTAAEALASQYPMGAGSFGPGSSRWSTIQGATTANPTHRAVSGMMDEGMIEAFRISSDPIFMVLDNPDDTSPVTVLAACEPPLYRCVSNEEV